MRKLRILLTALYWKLCKPEYLANPIQGLRSLLSHWRSPGEVAKVRLNWGLEIRLSPGDAICNAIWRHGVHDLVLSETVWRLLETGENSIDVGANIGFITSLMAARISGSGSVHSFEPHPELFQELRANVNAWARGPEIGRVTVHNLAVSSFNGVAELEIPGNFESNRGGASLRAAGTPGSAFLRVQVQRLDEVMEQSQSFGLMKVDVEGHEAEVFRGAAGLLAQKRVRDIVFEDYGPHPTPPMQLLESFGYSLFALGRSFRGPRLLPPDRYEGPPWSSPNYLATLDPKRAEARMRPKGWKVLQRRIKSIEGSPRV
jgi:FkbM family methyltransferase